MDHGTQHTPSRSVRPTLAAVLALLCTAVPADEEAGTVRRIRLGIYENRPKVFTDEAGDPAGIFVDILAAVAREEGWEIEPVPGTWAEGLERLADGGIDLMPDVAYSRERDRVMDFNRVPVLESWSQLYARRGVGLGCLADLDGRRVTVLAGSIQEPVLRRLLAGFGYETELVPVDSYADAFALTVDGGADAAVANHFFGDYYHRRYGLEKTGIVFNPVDLHYAAAEGCRADLLAAIDRRLRELREEPDSAYYAALGRWTERPPETMLPSFVVPVLVCLGGGLVLAAGLILLLRAQVRSRTRHLDAANRTLRAREEQLVRSRKLEMAGRLAAGIGHDFNNLLCAVLGYADLLLAKMPEDDTRRAQAEGIRQAGLKARDLAGQLLALGREQPLERRVLSIDELLSGIGPLLPQAVGKTVELDVRKQGADCRVEADRRQLERVFLNLAINARDAMPEGGALRISAAVESLAAGDNTVTPDLPPGDYVAVEVADTGCGMDAATTERLFEPFFTTKAEAGGTGLGLAIVYGIVTRHGGGLRVVSEPGRGTAFTVLLPAA